MTGNAALVSWVKKAGFEESTQSWNNNNEKENAIVKWVFFEFFFVA